MVFGIRLREVEFSAYSTWKTKRFFWHTRLRKTKGIFGGLALGNEKPKDTLWIPSDIGWLGSGAPGFRNGQNVPVLLQNKFLQVGYHWKVITVRAGYLILIAILQFWESDQFGAPSPPASILGLITCRFQSITLKLQFKW
ncbi:hypothetical protein RIR_jg12271.t1 [Rhizophagus irregularis DAOM 181602=DAOM 197198]|nr:hypothetical protein RIR_jg12271.t1 [Rhizophagus irregularis DAOM 181602=DAOM 197198]